jgi:hypothetical protein
LIGITYLVVFIFIKYTTVNLFKVFDNFYIIKSLNLLFLAHLLQSDKVSFCSTIRPAVNIYF